MARIPFQSTRQVVPGKLPTPYMNMPGSLLNAPRRVAAQFASGTRRLSEYSLKVYDDTRRRAKAKSMADATADMKAASSELLEGPDGLYSKFGDDATDAGRLAEDEFKRRLSKVAEGLTDEVTREEWRTFYGQREQLEFRIRANRHVRTERLKAEFKSFDALMKTATSDAIDAARSGDTEQMARIMRNAQQQLVDFADARGMSMKRPSKNGEGAGDGYRMLQEWRSGTYVTAIDALLKSKKVNEAQGMFDDIGDDILPEDRAKVEADLEPARDSAVAREADAKVFDELNPFYTSADRKAAFDSVEAEDDDEVHDKRYRNTVAKFNELDRQRDQIESEDYQSLYEQVRLSTPEDSFDLEEDSRFRRMRPERQRGLLRHQALVAAGQQPTTDPAYLYNNWYRTPVKDKQGKVRYHRLSTDEDFAAKKMGEFAPYVEPSMLLEMMKFQEQAGRRARSGSGGSGGVSGNRSAQARLQSKLAYYTGEKDERGLGVVVTDAEQGLMKLQVDRMVDDKLNEPGRKQKTLTGAEMEEISNEVIGRVIVNRNDPDDLLLSGAERLSLASDPAARADMVGLVEHMPYDEIEQIRDWMASKGNNTFTREQITTQMVANEYGLLYMGDNPELEAFIESNLEAADEKAAIELAETEAEVYGIAAKLTDEEGIPLPIADQIDIGLRDSGIVGRDEAITDEMRQEGLEMLRTDAAESLAASAHAPDVGPGFFPIARYGRGYIANTISSRDRRNYPYPLRSLRDVQRRKARTAARYRLLVEVEGKTDAEAREFLGLPPGPLSMLHDPGAELKDVGSE